MRSDTPIAFVVGVLVGAAVMFSIMIRVAIALQGSIDDLKKEAVERGAAHYSATTGEWQWKK